MDQLNKFGPFAALSNLWGQLTGAQRAMVLSFAGLAVVVVVLTASVASKPKMAVMFSGLDSEDAGAIVQKLNDEKVPYKLSGDGSTIEVPSDKVYDLRLKMATQGLPQGGSVGFELFDKSNFGMTEFTERLNYQRAIQGELTRTICQLAPVMSARVHIAIPEDKVYSSEQQQTTASVVLKLRRGMPLSDDQIAGVVHLVSSAVEGLKPANVTIVDSQGNVLSEALAGSGSGGGRMTANQSKIKRQYESELAQNLQSMLARIVGPDKAVVRVSADMDFDQRQVKSEVYEPISTDDGPRGVLLSEEKTDETYSGRVTPPAPAGQSTIASPGDNYNRTQSSTQYEVSKKIEETTSAPGQVKRLSVAVLVDEVIPAAKVGAIREAVTAAAGIDGQRGDVVTVQRIAFDTSSKKAMEEEMAKAGKSETIRTLAKDGGAVLLLIVFFIMLRSIVKQIKVQAPEPEVPPVPDVEPEIPNPMQEAAKMIEDANSQSQEEESEAPAETKKQDDIPIEVAQSSPEDLARLVRTWMSES